MECGSQILCLQNILSEAQIKIVEGEVAAELNAWNMFCGDTNMEMCDGKRCLNKGEIIKRGWTESAILALLGEPDRTRRNHLYKNTKRIQLYWENRVIEMEKTEEFQNYIRRKRK